jgi:hypothetical protein
MKRYALASTLALIIGWIAAILFHSIFSISVYGSLRGGDLGIIIVWSFIFMMLSNGFFVQLPHSTISHFCRRSSRRKFLLASVLYALTCFTILIGWLWIQAIYNDANRAFGLAVYAEAAIIGLGFGFFFPRFWKFATPS